MKNDIVEKTMKIFINSCFEGLNTEESYNLSQELLNHVANIRSKYSNILVHKRMKHS